LSPRNAQAPALPSRGMPIAPPPGHTPAWQRLLPQVGGVVLVALGSLAAGAFVLPKLHRTEAASAVVEAVAPVEETAAPEPPAAEPTAPCRARGQAGPRPCPGHSGAGPSTTRHWPQRLQVPDGHAADALDTGGLRAGEADRPRDRQPARAGQGPCFSAGRRRR